MFTYLQLTLSLSCVFQNYNNIYLIDILVFYGNYYVNLC